MYIKINSEFVLLGQFLQMIDITSSGGESKIYLMENYVLVNDEKENRRGRKLYSNDIIEIENKKYIIK